VRFYYAILERMKDVETFRDFIVKGCRVRLYRDGRWESLDRKWKWKEPVAVAKVMGKKHLVLMPDGRWVVRKKVSFNPRDYKWGILGMIAYGVLSVVERMCYGIGRKRLDEGDDIPVVLNPIFSDDPENIYHSDQS